MKKIFIGIALFIFIAPLFVNAQIEGTSESFTFNMKPKYKQGIPPNIYVSLSYVDDNNNSILESDEKSMLKITLHNKGKGKAQGLKVKLIPEVRDNNLIIKDGMEIPFLMPDEQKTIEVPIISWHKIKTHLHKIKIEVTENFGYDMDPAYLKLQTLEYQKPKLVYSGYEIIDVGEGTGAIKEDGKLQAGEMVKAKITIQNAGQNIAENTKYKIFSKDPNIYIENGSGELGDLKVGEVIDFVITLSPNKRVSKDIKLPIYLSLIEDVGEGSLEEFQLPWYLDEKAPEANILEVVADINGLKQDIELFEFNSSKIKTNVGNVVDISLAPVSQTKRKNAIAVIIGVEKYKELPPAPYATNDADVMKKYCENTLGIAKSNIYVYKNDDVSGFFFDDIFNSTTGELQKAIVKGETELFVFYSGHGMPDKKGQNVYLFPSDGKASRLAVQGYNLKDFYKNLDNLGAKSTTVFLDACFSGSSRATEEVLAENLTGEKGVTIKLKYIDPWKKNKSFTLFSSSSFEQTSLGFDKSKTGLFTYFLAMGMRGKADANSDKKITMGELKNYVIKNVDETSTKIHGKQTPIFNGNEDAILIEF